jgi:hypothetical protein
MGLFLSHCTLSLLISRILYPAGRNNVAPINFSFPYLLINDTIQAQKRPDLSQLAISNNLKPETGRIYCQRTRNGATKAQRFRSRRRNVYPAFVFIKHPSHCACHQGGRELPLLLLAAGSEDYSRRAPISFPQHHLDQAWRICPD